MTDRILITGGAGFIGSFLTEHFLQTGAAVRVLDNLDPQVHPQGKPPVYFPPGAELVVADVRDLDAVKAALAGIDIVIHCAAAVGVAQSTYRIKHYIDTNVGGTATLLNAIIDGHTELKKLVVFASMSSYGEGLYRRPSDGALIRPLARDAAQVKEWGWEVRDPNGAESLEPVAIPETAALLSRNIYALSKRYQEELVLSFAETYNVPAVSLRLFNVYGPRQSLSNPYTGVLAMFLSRILSGQPPIVYEDGLQSRDFISVHDVVRLVARAVADPRADGQILNAGTGVARTIRGVAETLIQLAGRQGLAPQIMQQFRKGDVRHCVADVQQAQELLGFTAETVWDAGLSELIAWSAGAQVNDLSGQAQAELVKFRLLA